MSLYPGKTVLGMRHNNCSANFKFLSDRTPGVKGNHQGCCNSQQLPRAMAKHGRLATSLEPHKTTTDQAPTGRG